MVDNILLQFDSITAHGAEGCTASFEMNRKGGD